MDENKPSTDSDDAAILAKFRNLLNKYQNRGKTVSVANTVVGAVSTLDAQADDVSQEAESDKIPTLTEIVILHPSVIQPQPKRPTLMRQMLDAALEDTGIEMGAIDRKALASALEVRLTDQVK